MHTCTHIKKIAETKHIALPNDDIYLWSPYEQEICFFEKLAYLHIFEAMGQGTGCVLSGFTVIDSELPN